MSATFSLTSGDPAADRRVDFALMLLAEGDAPAAVETMREALDLVPGWALGWYQLGEFLESAGDMTAAVDAWRRSLDIDPSDHSGASLKLALAGVSDNPAAPPSAFVEMLFDQYAKKFDEALVNRLGYRAPILLEAAIRATGQEHFGLVLDLGCGTGLMGERLRSMCDRLEGFDLSSEMLKQAKAKGVYDRLDKADLLDFAYSGPAAELVTAADVFIYLGALDAIFLTVARILDEDGLLVFSVEKLDGAGDYALQPSRRYAHSEGYVRRMLAQAGLEIVSMRNERIRNDRKMPVDGLIVVARK